MFLRLLLLRFCMQIFPRVSKRNHVSILYTYNAKHLKGSTGKKNE